MLSQQRGYGLLKYSALECYRHFCKSCMYAPVNASCITWVPSSWLNAEMPARCRVWGSEMTRHKGGWKQSLLFPPCWPGEPCQPREQRLPGVLGWGHQAPLPRSSRARAGAKPRLLWLHGAFALPGREGAQGRLGIWAPLWASLRAGPGSPSCHPRALGRVWSYVGRRLSPVRDPLGLHDLKPNLTPELYAENMRQVNVSS